MIVPLKGQIYQGNWEAIQYQEYRRFPIGAVINLYNNAPPVFPVWPAHNGEAVNLLWCPFGDEAEGLDESIVHAISEFAVANWHRGILVHCYGGSNRSSAISALLLHRLEKMTPDDACKLIRRKNDWMGIHGPITARLQEITGERFYNPTKEESRVDE